jgi:hypothetical protein
VLPKTTALGGVAAGRTNTNETLVAISVDGGTPRVTPRLIVIATNTVGVTVFDVT